MLMAFDALVQRYNMKLNGVLHVGAHLAEEAEEYSRYGNPPVLWIEANPRVIPVIERNLARWDNQTVVQALVYSEDGAVLDFNVTNYDGMSSSILEFGTHPTFSPDTVFIEKIELPTKTIDTIVAEQGFGNSFNFLNMDLQGAELYALKGATNSLKCVDYVMTEVNKDEVYVGCAKVNELDEFLEGFQRVDTYWVGDQGWGDALYVRSNLL